MTEKRFTTIESGIDYGVIDNATNERLFDVNITTKLNDLNDENEQLKQFKKQVKKELQESYELYVEATIVAPAVINNLAKRLGIDLND